MYDDGVCKKQKSQRSESRVMGDLFFVTFFIILNVCAVVKN